MDWLERPLVCDGAVVGEPIDSSRLTDADLWAICLRMHIIFGTVEMPRAEERWMPVELFDAIDTLESMVLFGHPSPAGHSSPPRLAEWAGVIRQFGAHYQLAGRGPIVVDPAVYREVAGRYRGARQVALDYAAPSSRGLRIARSVQRGSGVAAIAFLSLFVTAWVFLLWLERDGSGPYMGLALIVGGLGFAAGCATVVWLVAAIATRRAR